MSSHADDKDIGRLEMLSDGVMWWAAARDWTNFRSEATHAVIWQIRRNAFVGTGPRRSCTSKASSPNR